MMKTRLLALVLLSVLSSSYAQEEGPVFKGQELSEFNFDFAEDAKPEELFTITSEGVLEIRGKGKPDACLQTLDDLENYELSFRFRWVGAPGKAGIMVHCTESRYLYIWPKSVEIDLDAGHVGELVLHGIDLEVAEEEQKPKLSKDRHRRFTLAPKPETSKGEAKNRFKGKEKPKGEWNELRIVAYKDALFVYLNDGLVNHATQLSLDSGYLSLQVEGSNLDIAAMQLKPASQAPVLK